MTRKTRTIASLLITHIFIATGCLTIQPYSEITPYNAELKSGRIKATLLLSQTNKLLVLSLGSLDLTGRHRHTYDRANLVSQFRTVDIRTLLINGFYASSLKNSPIMDVEVIDNGLQSISLKRTSDTDDFLKNTKTSYYDFHGHEDTIKNPYVLEITVYNWGLSYGLLPQGMFEQPFIHVIATLHDVNKNEILYKAVLNDTRKGHTVEHYILGSPLARNYPHYPIRSREIFDILAHNLEKPDK